MKDKDYYIKKILDCLIPAVKPSKVIIFGSFAQGTQREESDLDLLVVTGNETEPGSYDENMEIYLNVSAALKPVKKEISLDIIVHTIPMHRRFVELHGMFSREITGTGIVVYEAHN